MQNTKKYNLRLDLCPVEIRAGLEEVLKKFPENFKSSKTSVNLVFRQDKSGGASLSVNKGEETVINYREKIDAFRALGRLLGEDKKERDNFTETAKFSLRGVMFDVSRNGVLLPETVCDLLCRIALMGINMAILYTEDVFEIKDEPFFGYLRGRYTEDELRAVDQYAGKFGIEMFPCIQTLGHMYEIFQWPAFKKYSDTHQIFLADDEPTMQFIEKMIKAAIAPFRSNRIHIGLDESKDIGSGRYRDINGAADRMELFCRHVTRINGICEKLGLKPMMWSDMFFKLSTDKPGDYDKNAELSGDLKNKIPGNIQQVYWDYYGLEKTHYCEFVDKHKKLGAKPVMAGGILTWNRFWATLPFSFKAIDACMRASLEKGLDEVFMTMWADGGAECDVYSSLPGIQYFAEYGYAEQVDAELVRKNFRGSCAAIFDDFVKASELDTVPSLDIPENSSGNPSKFLLWQDIFFGIMDPLLGEYDFSAHYGGLAECLKNMTGRDALSKRLVFPALTAETLELKAGLSRRIYASYKSGDKNALREIVEKTIPELRKRVKALWKAHRDMWLSIYKPFGWEVIERNYGFLTLRLDTAAMRLGEYISGELEKIPELEDERQPLYEVKDSCYPIVSASRVISPTVIK